MSHCKTRPPTTGFHRLSLATGTSFETLYTTSYLAPHHPKLKRSASDTFIVDRARERIQRDRRDEEAEEELLLHQQQDSHLLQPGTLSLFQLLCLTICMAGVQFTWTVELAYGTPYLLSLDLSKDMTALVWLAGPLSGLIIQPVIGALSDQCTSRLGRRRPFILLGGLCVCLSMLCIAYAKELGAWIIVGWSSDRPSIPEKMAEQERRAAVVVAIFAFYILDFSLNAVQASCRALILDIPPLWQQQQANAWAARLSNGAMVIGYFTGFVDLVKVLSFLGNTQVKVFCLIAVAIFILTVGITCATTSETVLEVDDREEDNTNHWYDTFTYIWDILRTLPTPIQRLCNVQFFAWLGWFPFLFYSTTWVSDIYFHTHPKPTPDSWAKGTRAGSFALLLHAIISVLSGIILPWLVERKPCWHRLWTVKNVYTGGTLLFSLLMLATIFISTVWGATVIVAAAGISWSIILWIPFALVGEYINTLTAAPRLRPSDPASVSSSRRGHYHLYHHGEVGSNASLYSYSDDDDESRPISFSSSRAHSSIAAYGTLASEGAADDFMIPPPAEAERDQEAEEEALSAGMVLGVHNIFIVLPQFAVAIIASLIFRVVSWVEHGQGQGQGGDGNDEEDANVAWVLAFGGVMGLVATALSLRIIEVPIKPADDRIIRVTTGRMSI